VLGLGFAEYGLGLVPLALLAAVWRRQTGRSWGSICRLAVLLASVVVGWHSIRTTVIGSKSASLVIFDPSEWLVEGSQLIGVGLFWGNSVWSMLGPQPWALAVTIACILLAAAWLIAGLIRVASSPCGGAVGWLERVDVGLLLPATLAVTFPMLIMSHVSELYGMPVLIGVALLAGRAAEGWRTAGDTQRSLAFAVATLAIAIGVWAGSAKIGAIAAAGRSSDQQVQQILTHIPPHAQGWRIATVFDPAEPLPQYSVFAPWTADWEVVDSRSLAWFHPSLELQLQSLVLPDACLYTEEHFDLVLKWDRATGQYHRREDGLESCCRGQ